MIAQNFFNGILGEPMEIVCLDLEGVLVPEIWINFAKKTGIKELEELHVIFQTTMC